jgi:hypothetical protein
LQCGGGGYAGAASGGRKSLRTPPDELVAAAVGDVRYLLLVVLEVGVRAEARRHRPVVARLLLVAAVGDDAGRPVVTGDAGQRVVELVRQLHLANTHPVHLLQLAVDRRPVALGHVVVLAAVEDLGRLDAHDHRELAGVDHLAGLEGCLDDAIPALAWAALLRVDVVLQRQHVLRLETHRVHLVAGVPLDGVDVAQGRVVDEQIGEEPQPAPPRALEVLVVGLLVDVGVVGGPARERGPAVDVVSRRGVAVREEVLHHRRAAVGAVVGAVHERVRDAVGMPRAPAMDRAAQELEGHAVQVSLDQALRLAVRSRRVVGRPGHVDLRFGVGRAAAGRLERERGTGSGGDADGPVAADGELLAALRQGQREPVPAGVGEAPVGVAARRGRGCRGGAVRAHEVPGLPVEQVAPERRGLHADRLGRARVARGRPIAVALLHDEPAVGRLHGVAPTCQRVTVGGVRGGGCAHQERDQRSLRDLPDSVSAQTHLIRLKQASRAGRRRSTASAPKVLLGLALCNYMWKGRRTRIDRTGGRPLMSMSPPERPREESLDQGRARKLALIVGVLFVITFITSIAALLLYDPILNKAGYIVGGADDARIRLGAFLEVLLAIANIGTAVVLYPVVKRESRVLSLSFVASRIVESTFIVIGAISLLSVLTLQQDAGGADRASLVLSGQSLVALHDWTFLIGPGFCVGVGNGLILGYLMYRSGLVPRGMAMLGLIGGPLIFASSTAILFDAYEQTSETAFFFSIPEIAWEASLGIYLIAKGFRRDAVARLIAEPALR